MAAPKNPNTVAARAAKAARDRKLKLDTAAQLLRDAGYFVQSPARIIELMTKEDVSDSRLGPFLWGFMGYPRGCYISAKNCSSRDDPGHNHCECLEKIIEAGRVNPVVPPT